MFKKGDKVIYSDPGSSNGPLFFNGNTYTVHDINNGNICIELADNGNKYVWFPKQYFSVVPPIAITNSSFNVGDRVRLTVHYNDLYWPKGHEFTVIDIDGVSIEGLGVTGYPGYVPVTSVELVTNPGSLKFSEVISNASFPMLKKEEKPCTCDSKDLFNKGCTCGSVKKIVWGLRA